MSLIEICQQRVPFLRLGDNKSFVLDNIIALAGWLLGELAALLYYVILGRILSPADYGIIAANVAAITLLNSPATFVTIIAARYSATMPNLADQRHLFFRLSRVMGLLGIALAALMAVSSSALADFFQMPQETVLVLAPSAFLCLLLPVARGMMQGRQRFLAMSTVYVSEPALRTLVGALLGLSTGAVAAVAGIPLGMFVACIVAGWLLWPMFRAEGKPSRTADGVWKYAIASVVTFLGLAALQQMDTLLAKHLFEPTVAGQYAAAATVGKMVFFATGSVGTVMFPAITQKVAQGLDPRPLLGRCLLVVATAALVLGIPFSLYPELTLTLVCGSGFREAAPWVPLYVLAASFISLVSVLISYFMAADMKRHIPVLWLALAAELILLFGLKPEPISMLLVVTTTFGGLLLVLLGISAAPIRERIHRGKELRAIGKT